MAQTASIAKRGVQSTTGAYAEQEVFGEVFGAGVP
jgi:hypothetical protein